MFRAWLGASIVWIGAIGALTVPGVYEEWIDKSDETHKVAFYGVKLRKLSKESFSIFLDHRSPYSSRGLRSLGLWEAFAMVSVAGPSWAVVPVILGAFTRWFNGRALLIDWAMGAVSDRRWRLLRT